MSSNTFSSDLTPDPVSRRAVIGSGLVALLGGIVVIAGLPFEWQVRVVMLAAWTIVLGRDLYLIAIGFRHCTRIRVDHTGLILVFENQACCSAATLQSGSLVLSDYAWLRFRTDNGRRHVELVRRKVAQDKDWRRLQVIWRHLGAGG